MYAAPTEWTTKSANLQGFCVRRVGFEPTALGLEYEALRLVARGDVSPEVALSYVVWPGRALSHQRIRRARRQAWLQEIRDEAYRLYEEESWSREVCPSG
jgi:hypothetical protein